MNKELVKKATVKIWIEEDGIIVHSGTGFWVSANKILTCYHVLLDSSKNETFHIYIGKSLEDKKGVQILSSSKEKDMALLLSDEESEHWLYLNDLVTDDSKLSSYGFSSEFPSGDNFTVKFNGNSTDNNRWIKYKGDRVVTGFSGSALLNETNGCIVGIVTESFSEKVSLGGLAVPTEIILECFEELRSVEKHPEWEFIENAKLNELGVRTLNEYMFEIIQGYKSYNHFLVNDKLEYVPRRDYKKLFLEETSDLITEDCIIDDLIVDHPLKKNLGRIISGEGGIGKTRLMYQIALEMQNIHEYRCYPIDSSFDKVDELFRHLEKEKKYLFVFDYIEENESFVQFVEKSRSRTNIKIIANCRNTYDGWDIYENYVKRIPINSESKDEKNYQDWVCKRIVTPIFTENLTEENKVFFKSKPAFAVFIRFLFNDKKTEEDLKGFTEFKTWLVKRLKLTLAKKNVKLLDCIPQLILLPIIEYTKLDNQVRINDFKDSHNYLSDLMHDGWISESTTYAGHKRLDIVHDTIKDELFKHFLDSYRKRVVFIDKIIDTSLLAQNQSLEKNWFRALERISYWDRFTDLEKKESFFYELFSEYLSRGKITQSTLFQISKTSLLTEQERFKLIQKYSNHFDNLEGLESFGLSLQYAMNFFSKLEERKEKEIIYLKKIVINWLENNAESFIKNGFIADRFISTYINLFGIDEVITPHFENFVELENTEYGSFVISSWLKSNGDYEKIRDYLTSFLKENIESLECKYVLYSCITNQVKDKAVQPFLLSFLEKFSKQENLSYIIEGCISYDFYIEDISSYIEEYLEKYSKEKGISYVLQACLRSQVLTINIEKYIKIYLKKYCLEKEASFILSSCVEKGLLHTKINQYIQSYLDVNASEKEAGYILIACINVGILLDILENYIEDYLAENLKEELSSSLLQVCIKQEVFINIVEKYLKENSQEKEASFILSPCVEKGLLHTKINQYIQSYLDVNASEKEAGYILIACINVGILLDILENYIEDYLAENLKEELSSSLLQVCIKQEVFINIVEKYLKENSQEKEASFILSPCVEKGLLHTKINQYIQSYLDVNASEKEASHILAPCLEKGLLHTKINQYIQSYLDVNASEKEASHILAPCLEKGLLSKNLENYIKKYLEKNSNQKHASRILAPCLKRELSIDKIYIQDYLDTNSTEIQASHILVPCLEKGLLPTKINQYIESYLEVNATEIQASHILVPCLEKGLLPTKINQYIESYLEVNATEIQASHILVPCLEKGLLPTKINQYIESYLKVNAGEKEAGYVLRDFSKKSVLATNIVWYITIYLKYNSKERVSYYFIKYCIKENLLEEKLESYIEDYLKENSKEKEATYILQDCLKKNFLSKRLCTYIINYLENHSESKNSYHLFLSLFLSKIELNNIGKYIQRYTQQNSGEKASRILNEYLNYTKYSKEAKKVAYVYLDSYASEESSLYIILKLFPDFQQGNLELNNYIISFFSKEENLKKYHSAILLFKLIEDLANDKNFIRPYFEKYLKFCKSKPMKQKLIEEWLKRI